MCTSIWATYWTWLLRKWHRIEIFQLIWMLVCVCLWQPHRFEQANELIKLKFMKKTIQRMIKWCFNLRIEEESIWKNVQWIHCDVTSHREQVRFNESLSSNGTYLSYGEIWFGVIRLYCFDLCLRTFFRISFANFFPHFNFLLNFPSVPSG